MKSSKLDIYIKVISMFIIGGSLSYWVLNYGSSWPNTDDFNFFQLSNRLSDGKLKCIDILLLKNKEHFLGIFYLIGLSVLKFTAFDFRIIIFINAALLMCCIVILYWCINTSLKTTLQLVLVILITILTLMNPIQSAYLLWAFQLWWYLLLFFSILIMILIERFRCRIWPISIIISTAAFFCGAAGVFLWLIAPIQLFLIGLADGEWLAKNKKSFIIISLVHIIIFTMCLWMIIHFNTNNGFNFNFNDIGGLLIYIIELLGSVFGLRSVVIIASLGFGAFFLSAFGTWYAILFCKQSIITRIGVLNIFLSLCWAVAFAFGRYKYGINWALSTFHAAPTLIPFFLGLGFIGAGLIIGCWNKVIIRFISLIMVCYAIAPFFTASKAGYERANEMYIWREASRIVFCSGSGFSEYVQLKLNGLQNLKYIFNNSRTYLTKICSNKSGNHRVYSLLYPPKKYQQLMTINHEYNDALKALWDVYMTQIDLQRTFSSLDPNLTEKLICFAYDNAFSHNSGYKSKLLRSYSNTYVKLYNMKK